MFRDAVSRETALGKSQKYMDAGKLVPDAVTIGIVEQRLAEDDCKTGFLLDGFPRTTVQAEALDRVLSNTSRKIDVAINITVPNEILIKRLSGRVSCKECKVVYNLQSNPSNTEGICDKCGGELIQRSDDQGETVAERLKVYQEQTNPLLTYYARQNVLQEIDGNRDSKLVFADIKNLLESLK